MALVIPPGYGQAVYRFALAGDSEEMLSTLGYAAIGSLATGQGAADQLFADFIVGFPSANIVAGYTFTGTRVLVGQAGGSPLVFESTASSIVGSNVGPALPPNCAYLVSKRTALGGRAHRGRMYLPPFLLGEDAVPVTGVMLEAQRSALQTRVNSAFGSGEKVILHDSLTPGALPPTVITSFRVQPRLATQRRRLRP